MSTTRKPKSDTANVSKVRKVKDPTVQQTKGKHFQKTDTQAPVGQLTGYWLDDLGFNINQYDIR